MILEPKEVSSSCGSSCVKLRVILCHFTTLFHGIVKLKVTNVRTLGDGSSEKAHSRAAWLLACGEGSE